MPRDSICFTIIGSPKNGSNTPCDYVYIFLNCEINPLGISKSLSPREIILRRRLDWTRHCCGTAGVPLEFSQYVEAESDPDVTNNMVSRTFAAVYLGPTGNIQGTKKVFDLMTGSVKKVRTVKSFPLPTCVIDLVNA